MWKGLDHSNEVVSCARIRRDSRLIVVVHTGCREEHCETPSDSADQEKVAKQCTDTTSGRN